MAALLFSFSLHLCVKPRKRGNIASRNVSWVRKQAGSKKTNKQTKAVKPLP